MLIWKSKILKMARRTGSNWAKSVKIWNLRMKIFRRHLRQLWVVRQIWTLRMKYFCPSVAQNLCLTLSTKFTIWTLNRMNLPFAPKKKTEIPRFLIKMKSRLNTSWTRFSTPTQTAKLLPFSTACWTWFRNPTKTATQPPSFQYDTRWRKEEES